ncbi:EthD domain-containing protein [Saccharopolyspora flava]|nr:EthD domain-containing protein [Saccharopolyspora flava]
MDLPRSGAVWSARGMMKLVLCLHADDLEGALDSDGFRAELAAVGVRGVQLNVDDADVAPAMRFGPGERVTGLVSVWTAGDPAAAVRVVAEASGEARPHAYRVSEKVRLDPLPVADGERADVYAQVALLRRPESMTREEYLEYWLVHHTPIAIRTQNTSGYVQNVVEEALTPESPDVAAIVEEHFPMAAMTDPHAFHGSGGDDDELHRRFTELMGSVARFGGGDGLDVVPTSRYSWSL